MPGYIVFGIVGQLKMQFKATLLVRISKLHLGPTSSAAS